MWHLNKASEFNYHEKVCKSNRHILSRQSSADAIPVTGQFFDNASRVKAIHYALPELFADLIEEFSAAGSICHRGRPHFPQLEKNTSMCESGCRHNSFIIGSSCLLHSSNASELFEQ
jgi:hypothetical protein